MTATSSNQGELHDAWPRNANVLTHPLTPGGTRNDTEGLEGSQSDHTFVAGRRAKPSRDQAIEPKAGEIASGSIASSNLAQENASSSKESSNVIGARAGGGHVEFPFGSQRYQTRHEIGRGGCGVVVRAFDRQLHREVVVKRVLANAANASETEARFFNEARITGRLEHPGIVPVYEIGRDDRDATPFYAMKWIQGATLSEMIAQYHKLPNGNNKLQQRHALLVRFHQVCQTLAYAHRMNVVHRDLKPANIIAGQFGETVVLDWGLAKQLGEDPSCDAEIDRKRVAATEKLSTRPNDTNSNDSTRREDKDTSAGLKDLLTQQGAVLGTAAYMSPEQARGESATVGCPSDVFSLGVILYEILSGQAPFRSTTVARTLERVLKADFKSLQQAKPGVPAALAAICHRALALSPSDRYQNANEFASDIQNYLSGAAVDAYPEPWWAKLDRLAGKHRTLVRSVFAALCTVSIVALTALAIVRQAYQSEIVARHQAQHESNERMVALDREEKAHSHALTQLQAARQAVDAWLIDLSGDLQFYPGLSPLRTELFERAKVYYQANASEVPQLPIYTIEVARARLRLGDLCRLSTELPLALTHYEAAAKLLLPIVDSHESEWRELACVQSANAHVGLALCQLDHSSNPNLAKQRCTDAIRLAIEALQYYPNELAEQSLVEWLKLTAGDWNDDIQRVDAYISTLGNQQRVVQLEAMNTLVRAHQIHARAVAATEQFSEAATSLERPAVIAHALAAIRGESRDFRLLVNLLEEQAGYHEKSQQLPTAIEVYQRIVLQFNQKLGGQDRRPDCLESRAHVRMKMGRCWTMLQCPKEASVEFESAERDLKEAWEILYGESIFRENIAISKANLGYAHLQAGSIQHADRSLREAIDMLQWLVKREGADTERVSRMTNCFLWLAAGIESQPTEEMSKLLQDSGTLIAYMQQVPEFTKQAQSLHLHRLWLLAKYHVYNKGWLEAQAICQNAFDSLSMKHQDADDMGDQLAMGRFHAIIAQCLLAQGTPSDAEVALLAARECFATALNSTDLTIATMGGIDLVESLCDDSFQYEGDRQAAVQFATQLCARCNHHPRVWYLLALATYRNGENDRASFALRNAKAWRTEPAIEDQQLEAMLREQAGE